MSKAVVFTMRLELELRADFILDEGTEHRSVSQIARETMHGDASESTWERNI